MTRILLAFFSSSGNTLHLSQALTDGLSKKGFQVKLYPIENAEDFPRPDEYDVLGIACPVFAFRDPIIIKWFLEHIPRPSEPKPAFVFLTYGGMIGNTFHVLFRRLRQAGFLPVWKGATRCEDNYPVNRRKWTMRWIHQNHPDEADHREVGDNYASELAEAIRNGNAVNAPYRIGSFLLDLSGAVYQRLTSRLIRHQVDRQNCNRCGLCIRYCPSAALKPANDQTPVPVKGKCIGCYRCVNICPTGAFRTVLSRRGITYSKMMSEIRKIPCSGESIFKRNV